MMALDSLGIPLFQEWTSDQLDWNAFLELPLSDQALNLAKRRWKVKIVLYGWSALSYPLTLIQLLFWIIPQAFYTKLHYSHLKAFFFWFWNHVWFS